MVDLGAARHVKKALGAIANLKPHRRLGFGADLDLGPFEIKRNFSWHRERLNPEAEAGIRGSVEFGHARIDEIRVQNAKNSTARLRQGCTASKERETLLLAQGQKPGEVIDIGIGDKNGPDGRLPLRTTWVQAGRSDDLLAEIGRGGEKQPALAVGANGE